MKPLHTMLLAAGAGLLFASLLQGCDSVETLTAHRTVPARVGWLDVQPVLQKSCTPCHQGAMEVTFQDSATAMSHAAASAAAVRDGWMPTAGSVPFSRNDREILLRWADHAAATWPQKQGD